MRNVLITGSNGYIGSHIVEQFVNNGVHVRCMVRKGSDTSFLNDPRFEIVHGDIRNTESLIKAMNGCECVVHNASFVGDWGKYWTFYETNVVGTLNVLKACAECGIRQVIMTGAVSSYGEENCYSVKNEESDFNSHYPYFLDSLFPNSNNFYRDTKAQATIEAMRYAAETGINLTIIEPVWVYGEREFKTGFYEYIKSCKEGVFAAPGSKKNKFHVIYVKDLVRAYYLSYLKKLPGVHRIIVGNSEIEHMDRIFGMFCEKAGVRKPILLPKFVIYPIGFLLELIYTLFRSNKPPLLSRSRINMFYDNIEYSTKKAFDLLGFRNEYSLEEGIQRTVNWYIENNLI